jgi:hypothetical protein
LQLKNASDGENKAMPKNRFSKKGASAATILTLLIFAAQAFCQSPDGSLVGAVQDQQEKIVIGALVTIKNKSTDIEITRSTDSSGKYAFLGLQPGAYAVAVEAEGFEPWGKKVQIPAAGQVSLNIQLAVRGNVTTIEVKDPYINNPWVWDPGTILTLPPEYLTELPNPSNSVMALVNYIGGVMQAPNANGMDQGKTMLLGTPASGYGVIVEGIGVQEPRWNEGINPPIRINPNIVDEFTVVFSPVNSEIGGGNGQIRIKIKEGGNSFRGGINYSGSGNFLNSGFGRYNWLNSQSNNHNYSANFSGPIIKRKLFFFVNFDRAMSRQQQDVAPVVLTPCARKGIYRYFSGFDNGNNANATAAGFGTAAIVKTVNADGTPYYSNPALNGAALQLKSVFGQLDPVAQALLAQDPVNCSAYDPYTNLGVSTFWETGTSSAGLRQLDTLTVPRFSKMMPLPNNYGISAYNFSIIGTGGMYNSAGAAGDGLNTAVHKWTRVTTGAGSVYSTFGGMNPERKTLNANMNYNYSDRHRITITDMLELQSGINATRNWDGSTDPNFAAAEGRAIRRPQQIVVAVTSTIKPNLLNEARFGLARTVAHQYSPMDDPDAGSAAKNMLQYLAPTDSFPAGYRGLPLLVGLGPQAPASYAFYNGAQASPSSFTFSPQGNGGMNFSYGANANSGSHPYGTVNNGLLPTFGGTDHRWTIMDNLTWMHGAHAFKMGTEIRLTRSYQESEGQMSPSMGAYTQDALTYPVAFGGISSYSLPAWKYPTNIGLVGNQMSFNQTTGGAVVDSSSGTYKGMLDLLTYMSGSFSEIRQQYYVNNPFQVAWNDYSRNLLQIVDMRQKEFSFFAKDDWRVHPALTLNLGARWEYYGTPFLADGMTVGLEGGGLSMFGVTGRSLGDWMPRNPVQLDDSYLTKQVFIGPGSPRPDALLYNRDFNNFGPAFGVSWQMPWLGRGRTIMRSGYQLSYRALGNASNTGYGASLANEPGTLYNQYYRGSTTDPYLSAANLKDHIPASQFFDKNNPPLPLNVLHITNHSQNYTGYDPNIRTPYTHNINFSITRILRNNITLDMRYVGTLSRKGVGDMNLNTPNFIYNGLLEALNAARSGGESPLLDRMLKGFVFAQYYANQTAANSNQAWLAVGAPGGPTGAAMVRTLYAGNLANGDYAAIATNLANLNYDKKVTNTYQMYGQSYGAGAARLINQTYPDIPSDAQGAVLRANGFPENFILGNPQMGKADFRSNLINSNYHAMQVQIQLRPTRGLLFTSTYTFSKQLANQPGGNMFGFFGGGTDTWTDPLNRSLDYKLLSYGHAHQWNNYGIMDLPVGPNGYFLRNLGNGMLRRVLEGWQISWNLQMQSGAPSQITGNANHLYNNANLLDLVPIMDPALNPAKDPQYGMELAQELAPSKGNLEWPNGSQIGYYYPGGVNGQNKYVIGADPQCGNTRIVGTWAGANCALKALYLALPDGSGGALAYTGNEAKYQGRAILQNPMPGRQGNFSRSIEGIGTFSLDMGMTKNVMITEGKSVQIRMQATNVLNHPSPCGYALFGGGSNNCPSLSLGQTDFGTVSRAGNYFGGGNRQFQGNFRLLF